MIIISALIVTACHSVKYQDLTLLQPSLSNTECKLVKHELGETCVSLNPQRIIVTEQVSLEALIALGLKPIATVDTAFIASKTNFLKGQMNDIHYIGKENQFNLETTLKLHPDLIIGTYGINANNYKLFSQIAPTVKLQNVHSQWKETLISLADIVNRTATAKTLLVEYQQRLEKLRTTLGEKINALEVSVGRFHGGNKVPAFRSQYSFPGSILTELGISMPIHQRQLIKNPDDTVVTLSLERIDLLDADVLFVAVDPGAREVFHQYQNSRIWQTMNVVQNQQVYSVDSSYWIFGSILSANAILDDLFKYLTQVKI
ncbi:iron-siderophore ABC transporter substrate-binding protein [Cronbergia sp. UHCC 0137]|uniref:iron-siderophore ABC transporter substrate-binding protein n=1 Tax=Cronbergia sp. UHCC 0137 TaxID=3110239 RepID=UPI002B1F2C40|nr:iron-siderophore ABC transporter substrate-binding protein [Cronbergia sp. UHCC 0137]MEA5617110.1 iron-siderophore ABC transporter substrate-binding protein [Cronbergia sp. UHCC 0137]